MICCTLDYERPDLSDGLLMHSARIQYQHEGNLCGTDPEADVESACWITLGILVTWDKKLPAMKRSLSLKSQNSLAP